MFRIAATRRTLLALCLGLGLITATAWAVVVSGKTFGDWDLPSGGSAGFATGALQDGFGSTVFKMKAKLAELPSPSLSTRIGTLDGELDDGVPGFPVYYVSGDWKATALTGSGSFSAVISRQFSPLGPVQLIGKMAGVFSDPPSFPNLVGKYKGEWKADL